MWALLTVSINNPHTHRLWSLFILFILFSINLENNIHRHRPKRRYHTHTSLKRIPQEIYDNLDEKNKIYDSKHESWSSLSITFNKWFLWFSCQNLKAAFKEKKFLFLNVSQNLLLISVINQRWWNIKLEVLWTHFMCFMIFWKKIFFSSHVFCVLCLNFYWLFLKENFTDYMCVKKVPWREFRLIFMEWKASEHVDTYWQG